MADPKQTASDFRYNSGEARVPWAAVGESVKTQDLAELVKFLVRPRPGGDEAYHRQFERVTQELTKLAEIGQPAGKLTLGAQVATLEQQVAQLLAVRHAVFLTNCTAGFEIAFKYAGLKAGDEVIAPAITFIATIAYPLSVGAKVVLADVDERTMNMDPADVARKLTPRTKVIMPVHIGGYPVDMDPIMRLAKPRGITVLEDAAHAFGSRYKGRMCGTIGHFGAFSFHEVKNINALGEGGILCTDLPFGQQFAKARFLGLDFSRQVPNWLYDVTAIDGKAGPFAAGNHSATELQAAGLLSQLHRLPQILAKRRAAAEYLTGRLASVDGILTPPADDAQTSSTHHLYLLQIDPAKVGADIQALKPKLAERGLVQIPHFAPLYKLHVLRQFGYDVQAMQAGCPVAEEAFTHRFTHLPLYDYDADQLRYMADAVIDAVRELKSGR